MKIDKSGRSVNIFDRAEEVCARLGIDLPSNLNTDDRIYRTSVTGRRHNKNGAIKLFGDGRGGIAWNWRTGETEVFFIGEPASALTAAERVEIAERRRAAEEALRRQYVEAAAKAGRIWSAAAPALPDHPYLERKGIEPYGIRERWGKLIIPVHGVNRDIISIQMIDAEGNKRFLRGAQNGGIFTLNPSRRSGPVLIAEGLATAASLAMATFCTTVCAFNASMLGEAAARVRAATPERLVIICADNDHLVGKAERQAEAVGALLAIPDFEGFERGEKDTDFNDLAAIGGLDEVGRQIRHAIKSGLADKKEKTVNQPEVREETPKEGDAKNSRDSGDGARQYVNGLDLKPFKCPEYGAIPNREFIYAKHYMRRYVSMTGARGGTGKTALITTEFLSMVSGKSLIGFAPHTQKRVWYVGEDPVDELTRRIMAAVKAHALGPEDIGDRLFIESFRDTDMFIFDMHDGFDANRSEPSRAQENRSRIIEKCIANKIDVLIIDPSIKTHNINENDNTLMNHVITAWVNIADRANISVELVLHSRKAEGGSPSVDDIRGASAQSDAARSARVLVKMTPDEAEKMFIENDEAWKYLRFGSSKQNQSPPQNDNWFILQNVILGNPHPENPDNPYSDEVQVVFPYRTKGILDGISQFAIDGIFNSIQKGKYRAAPKRGFMPDNWAGFLFSSIEGKNMGSPADRNWAKSVLDQWRKNGLLNVEIMRDEKTKRDAEFYVIGSWKPSKPIMEMVEDEDEDF